LWSLVFSLAGLGDLGGTRPLAHAKEPREAEKVALEYADAITDTRRDVDDELFGRMRRHYDDDTIAELTMIIAWENASSRFNRAFRIPSQGFWKR
jgi:alkylhydroperoxidase family enzyme